MNKKMIGRILFTFSCMIAAVFVFGLQASDIHAYAALKDETRNVNYVAQNIVWDAFDSNNYKIEYENAGMFSSKPDKPTNKKVTARITANLGSGTRTGKIIVKRYISGAGIFSKVAELKVVQNRHSCSYGTNYIIEKQPTCAQTGRRYRKCSICGDRLYETLSRTNTHSFSSWNVQTPITCGAAGVQYRRCSVCGKTETRTFGSPTGKHTWSDWYPVNVNCTSAGTEKRVCSVCGAQESRSIGAAGHVYRQIARQNPATKNGLTTITMKCDRCNHQFVCTESSASGSIVKGADYILCYERYQDNLKSFRKETDSFLDYKRIKGNYGVNTYVFYYSTYDEYRTIWNNFVPQKVRHIYEYGHSRGEGKHEFRNDPIEVADIYNGKRLPLSKKHATGNVYIFLCFAGNYCDTTPNSSVFPAFSTLKYYAYLCPDTYVIGVQNCGFDVDDYYDYTGFNGEQCRCILPSCSEFANSSRRFAAEYFDSDLNKCMPTIGLGVNIQSTNFLESYL